MKLANVHKLLTVIAVAKAKPDDSEELQALRNISLALIYIADAVAQIQKTQAAESRRARPLRSAAADCSRSTRRRRAPLSGHWPTSV